MKRSATMFAIAATVIALTGLGSGLAQAALEASPGPAASQGIISGKVASVDPNLKMLRIKSGLFKQHEYFIKESTKIRQGTRVIHLEDVKPGDEISASYDEQEGKRVISSMQVELSAAGATGEDVPAPENAGQ